MLFTEGSEGVKERLATSVDLEPPDLWLLQLAALKKDNWGFDTISVDLPYSVRLWAPKFEKLTNSKRD